MEITGSLSEHEELFLENCANPNLPSTHREDYARVIAIASLVGEHVDGDGNTFGFELVHSANDVKEAVGIYLFETDVVGLDRYTEIEGVDFDVNPKALSGKVDAAHAVLPGLLTVSYENSNNEEDTQIPVVVKGSFKRDFSDRFERVIKEVKMSQQQHKNGEIAFQPIAVVVAPPVIPESKSRAVQNDILLLTYYEDSAVSMDNAPWPLGFNQENIVAADRAVAALGRFNTTIGRHGDAKIKNIVQKPDGSTSMIDFETSAYVDLTDPVEAMYTATADLGMFLDSLEKRGFFSREPWRAFDVVEALGDRYLEQWMCAPEAIQDAVYESVVGVVETYRTYGHENYVASEVDTAP
jgi:hypothetical protein